MWGKVSALVTAEEEERQIGAVHLDLPQITGL